MGLSEVETKKALKVSSTNDLPEDTKVIFLDYTTKDNGKRTRKNHPYLEFLPRMNRNISNFCAGISTGMQKIGFQWTDAW